MRVKTALLAALIVFAGCSKSKENPPSAASSPPPSSGAKPGSGAAAEPAKQPIPAYEPAATVPDPIRAAIADKERNDKDRALDAGRKPGEVLAFFKIAPGQKVGELFSATGYTTEIIARVLGPSGKLYAQNSKDILDRFARKPLTERLAQPVMKNTVMVEQPTETPFPPEAKDLDAVICILNYHDYVWQKVDRAKLNAAVFAALKSGGVYGIVDHSAVTGHGVNDVETLHRIDEDVVKQEVTAAGFKVDAESDLLRNPADPRDWNSSPKAAAEKRGTSDRFTLRFVKP